MTWNPDMSAAPRDGTPVDLWWDYGQGECLRHPDCKWHDDANRWYDTICGFYLNVGRPTHWMPLPPPPGEQP